MDDTKLSKVERIKDESSYLRGTIEEELQQDIPFTEDNAVLLKAHGMYQQHDRDLRGQKVHSIMIRWRIPAGQISAEQYLVLDDLATRYANNTIKLTTRETVQFHGLIKGEVKAMLQEIHQALITSQGACGDVVRNVTACPAPFHSRARAQLTEYASLLSTHFLPHGNAYSEIWLDGEKVDLLEPAEKVEPFYGKTYLPRKFKIALAYPGDNCLDIFTNDLGFVAIVDDDTLKGFNVLVGGGLGMNHTQPETFPRLSDPLGFVTPEQLIPVAEQVIAVYRDNGDRVNRKHSRIKYLIHDWGIDRFRSEVEARLGYKLAPSAPLPPFEAHLHLGWHNQGDGRWFFGLSVENGRIRDTETVRLKTALAEIALKFQPRFAITANQDLLITNLPPEAQIPVETILRSHGVRLPRELSLVQMHSIACVALPTCSLAITEGERVLPNLIDELELELARLGLQDEPISVRMTGCPNGCARPYVADIGLVGRSLNKYSLFLGGRVDGTRLNKIYKDLVPFNEIVSTLVPLLTYFKESRQPGETFGDFCVRVGFDELLAVQAA
ncbi:MAG: NADPH-dependent assimilatory sulfite reductase hemoprotein subunit [Chloroflexi bacterium HGW-Chloroflexi-6]|nr:MAG: NADPH-dependent assimilatory sulfite reductase hemoprotein subunit [Chloroflexi bacterium HGW-Chloroflexi-6]